MPQDFNRNESPLSPANGSPPAAPPKLPPLEENPVQAARDIYEWFEQQGGQFVIDDRKDRYLLFENALYRISQDDLRFRALMMERIHIIMPEEPGAAIVLDALGSLCHLNGRRTGHLNWIHADLESDALYIHLHDEHNRVLRLSGRAEAVSNGSGPVLKPCRRMRPIDFDPEVKAANALQLLQTLVIDWLPIHPDQRWMVISWLLTAFFMDPQRNLDKSKALLKISGCSGKLDLTRMLCQLLYGASRLESGENDRLFEEASRNPLLAIVPLQEEDGEEDGFSMRRLLRSLAEGMPGRLPEPDGSLRLYRPQALAAVVDRDPFPDSALTCRSFEAECSDDFQPAGFDYGRQRGKISQARGRILSGVFQLLAREVVPGLRERRRGVLKRLQTEFHRHPKSRLDQFFSLMVVILQALMGELHPADEAEAETWRLVGKWIEDQGRIQQEILRGTSPTVFLMDSLAGAMRHAGDFTRELCLDFTCHKDDVGNTLGLSFQASAMQLMSGLQTLACKLGMELPYETPLHLESRLKSEFPLLKSEGWEMEVARVVRGEKIYGFRLHLE